MSDVAAGGEAARAADALIAALTATLSALDTSDIDAAAAAAEAVTQACADLAACGAVLPKAQLEQARTLQARCEVSAGRTQATVVAELLQSAVHRRATDAYGSTT